MKTTLAVMAALMVVGCNTAPVIIPDPVLLPETKTVEVPDWLLEKCPTIQQLPVKAYSGQDTVKLFQSLSDQSDACRAKDSILVDTVRKAFNLKLVPQGSK